MNRKILIPVFLFSILYGCEKGTIIPHNQKVETGSIHFKINYEVDNVTLQNMEMFYTTPNGYPYSIWKIQYIVSDFKFYNSSGVWCDTGFYFLDSQDSGKNSISVHGIPVGYYEKFSFLIGVKPEFNLHNLLPSTHDFQDMFWPEQMGGGYHFMKLEGRYSAGGEEKGFAMHIGQNGFIIPININKHFLINQKHQVKDFHMTMNINEWFRNPITYDFETDGSSIMGDSIAMMKIVKNGVDVFKIE